MVVSKNIYVLDKLFLDVKIDTLDCGRFICLSIFVWGKTQKIGKSLCQVCY